MKHSAWLFGVGSLLLVGCGGNTVQNASYAPNATSDSALTGRNGDPARKFPDIGVNSALRSQKVFAATSVWNSAAKNAVDPQSKEKLEKLGIGRTLTLAFGGEVNNRPRGISYYVVSGDTPRTDVSFAKKLKVESTSFPIPADAPLDGSPLIIVDRDTRRLFELEGAKRETTTVQAIQGGIWQLEGLGNDPALPVPILPGLIQPEEVFGGKNIKHALRIAISGLSAKEVPAGAQIRLTSAAQAKLAKSKLTSPVNTILKALRQYGAILADGTGAPELAGMPDIRWKAEELAPLLTLKLEDFELLKPSSAESKPAKGKKPAGATPSADSKGVSG